MKTKTWLITLGICAIIFGGLGYYAKSSKGNSAEWKSYSNPTFGYSISYPNNVIVTDKDSTDPNNPINDITLTDRTATIEITAPFYSPKFLPGKPRTQTTFAGRTATLITVSTTEKVLLVDTPADKTNSHFTITIDQKGQSNTLDQVLSTFTFSK